MVDQKDLLSRLKELDLKELEGNETVQKILENEKARHLVYDLAGVPVKIVAAFPREVRYFYEQNQLKQGGKQKMEDVEREAYGIAAQLCIEAPFNTPEFWEYYDTMTGKFWGVFAKIYEGITKSEEKIGDFRKK